MLVGNAAALPQIQMAESLMVGASHNVAANSVRGLAALMPGAISPAYQNGKEISNHGTRV